MQRIIPNWNIGDQITAARQQQALSELDRLFLRVSNENLSLTYNLLKQLTQVVDNENSITINISWIDFADPTTPKIYIQQVGDPLRYTISYTGPLGGIATVVYA